MKIIATVLILLITCLSCRKDREVDPRQSYLVKMTSYLGSTSYTYDNNNRLVSENFKAADASVTSDNTTTYSDFNAAGNPAKIINYVPARSSTTTSVLEYDTDNRLMKLSNYNASNVLTGYYSYTYLSNTVSETLYYPTGVFSQRYVYTFDQKGNITSVDVYNYTNTHVQRITYGTYDNKKSPRDLVSIIRRYAYSVNNATAYEIALGTALYPHTITHEYNADGYVTQSTTTNTSTGATRVVTYEYMKQP